MKDLSKYEKEFKYLEKLRKSGATNMWGASPYLSAVFGISHKEADKILTTWMKNYSELAKKYNWQR